MTLSVRRASKPLRLEVEMVEIVCLWCEARVELDPGQVEAEVTCPECLTSWLFEDEREVELALAA
jgi:DNA-directed RNA polymerase subunit RPC12/RpoP